MSDELNAPEIPEPEKSAPGEKQQPDPEFRQNGNGGVPHTTPQLDNEKLVKWIEATDKEIKSLKVSQMLLAGAMLALLAMVAKQAKSMPV